MELTSSLLNENLIYASPKIFERRRRILATTRDLIETHGYDGFSIRELCQRANVAPQTVYKAFENKERLVALTIREAFSRFLEARHFRHGGITLSGVIERLIASHYNLLGMRQFVLALVAIYFSPTAGDDLRVAARTNIVITLIPWAHALAEKGQLRAGMSLDHFIQPIIGSMFAVSLDWCRGELSDDEYLDAKLETLLICASGATRGQVRREADEFLSDLLKDRKLIGSLSLSAAPPRGAAAEEGR